MDKETIARYAASLDTLLNKDENGVEFWHARELMKYMGYTKWENFTKVIQRARSACQNAGQPVEAHFRDAKRDVELGSGAILLYLVVFRFGLPECLEIRKRWYFNAFAILQVVTGYDCMERNVTVFVCGLYAE